MRPLREVFVGLLSRPLLSCPSSTNGDPASRRHWELRIVVLLLLIQTSLLGYSATRHSPTHLEPAFLASGVSHWQFGRFELYRVNPPLVRMVAALPVLVVGCNTDWSRYRNGPGTRAEFPVGEDFIKANGPALIPLLIYARWACIPFNLIGAYFAYRWAKELYGGGAGLATLALYVFEPNLLAHGELITPDGACTAFGILAGFTFWRWLKRPSWNRAAIAAGALGIANLSKMSWLILFGLWPFLWLVWRWMDPGSHGSKQRSVGRPAFASGGESQSLRHPPLIQLAGVLFLAVYVINLGYAFDGFGVPLGEFQFVSTVLTGLEKTGTPGNRFRDSWVESLPVPLPRQYVLGVDSQKKDLEGFAQKSYLRGEWKSGGWWYYYLYGFLVKVPCGTWAIFALVVLSRLFSRRRPVPFRDELVLLLPALVLLVVVSSQTEFNIHLRYVFPSLGFVLIFLGQSCCRVPSGCLNRIMSPATLAILSLSYTVCSLTWIYPHHLAYFNDFIGGPSNGHRHLLGSSFDWGQDLLYLRQFAADTGVRIGSVKNGYQIDEKYFTHFLDLSHATADPVAVFISPNALASEPDLVLDGQKATLTLWRAK